MEAHKENRVRKKVKGKKFVKDKDADNVPLPSVDTPECLSAENVQRQSSENIEIPGETVSATATSMPMSLSQDRSEEAAGNGIKSENASAPSTVPSGVSTPEAPKCIPYDVSNDSDEEKVDQAEESSYVSPPIGTETDSTSSKSVETEPLTRRIEVSEQGHRISFSGEPPELENVVVHDEKQIVRESSETLNPEGSEVERCSDTGVRKARRSASGSESLDFAISNYKDSEHSVYNCEQYKSLLLQPSHIQIVQTSVRGKSPVASSNPSAPCLAKTADGRPTQKVQGSLRWAVEPTGALPLPSVGQWTTPKIGTDALKGVLTTSETQIAEVRPFITQFTSCFPIEDECAQAKSPLEKIPLKISWAELEQQIELTLDESEDEAWTTIEYYRMILREDLLPERRKKAESNAESMSLRGKSNNSSALSIKVSDSMKNLYSGTSLLHRNEHTEYECKCKPLSCQNPHPIYAYGASCQQSIPSKHNPQTDGQDFYPCATSYGVCHHRCPKFKKKCHLQLQPYHAHPRQQQAGGNKQQETWLNKTKSILCRAKNAFRTSFQFKSVKKNQSEAGKDTNVTQGSPCDINSSVDMQENRPAISEEAAQVMTAMSMSMTNDSPSAQLMFS